MSNPTISIEEVREAAAVSTNGGPSSGEYTKIATHMARKKVEQFSPLIEQLCDRSSYIMKRLAGIASIVMESRRENKLISTTYLDDLHSMKGYPYFTSVIRDIFFDFVDKTSKLCKDKCIDELLCTQLLYLDEELISDIHSLSRKSGKSDDIALQASSKLFNEMRNTILTNILLKCHNYFLFTMHRDLSGEILKDTSSFDDRLMEEIFELSKAKEQFKIDEEKEKGILASYSEKEIQLRDLTTSFTRFQTVKAPVLMSSK